MAYFLRRFGLASVVFLLATNGCATDQDKQTNNGTGSTSAGTAGSTSNGGSSHQNTEPRFDFSIPKGPVALSDWAENSAKGLCAFLSRKMPSLLNWGNYYPYEEPCIDFFANRFRDRLDLPSLVANGKLVFDPEAFGECLTTYSTDGNALMCVERLGTLKEGDACSANIECFNRDSEGKQLACNGVCTALLAKGDICDPLGTDQPRIPINKPCGYGMYCSSSIDFRCHNADYEFDYCDLDETMGGTPTCVGGLQCKNTNIGDYTGECLFFGTGSRYRSCGDGGGPVFDSAASPKDDDSPYQCESGPQLNEPCFAYFDDSCTHDAYCSASKWNSEGKCVLRKAIGELCDASTKVHSCVLGARCDIATNRCVDASRATIGESCDTHDDCYSGKCVEQYCVRPTLEELELVWKTNRDFVFGS